MFLSTTQCKHCQPIRIHARKTEIIIIVTFPPSMTWTLRLWSMILHKLCTPHSRSVLVTVSYLSKYRLGTGKLEKSWEWTEHVAWEVSWFVLVFPLSYLTELCYSSAKEKTDEFSTCNLYGHHFLMPLIREPPTRKFKNSKKLFSAANVQCLNHIH